ncbi:MAG: ATP-dependent DNA helicase RecG [bacterium]|nr:ATP-dependent DNA helicase RecG [bacterium]
MLNLDTPVEQINKVGKATAGKLKKLGILTVQDLLSHYPSRYDDFSQSEKIANLRPGMNINVQGTLEFIQNKRSPRQRMNITEALINDETGQLKIVWFNQPFIGRSLQIGDTVSLSGTVKTDYAGLQMTSPEYEKISNSGATHTKGLVPVYPLTGNLTNKQLRFLIKSVVSIAEHLEDVVPKFIRRKYDLCDIDLALKNIHFPESKDLLNQARRRLQFEELLFIQLATQLQKLKIKSQKSELIEFKEKETKEFVSSLKFQLTGAQKKAAWEIINDLQSEKPMSRLLEGDVGSGKTVTAALAMLNVALNKKQSALLVPTEILASQHYSTLRGLFKNTEITVGLLTSIQQKVNSEEQIAKSKKEFLKLIEDGKIDIIVGTHAMIQKNIEFKNLALAIIDEQHRFGVEQRKALRKQSGQFRRNSSETGNTNIMPHLLSMTATPIPRSLAQAVYGDLDLSIIDELPAGRKEIKTFLVPENKRIASYDFISQEIKNGRQAFVVCPLISESDKLGVKSVEKEFKKLNEEIFPDLKIAFLHGRVKSNEKDKIMESFLKNEINILVSTSVIEVGVDAPNATLMIIEGAERFGLAQLHQFRGRVGRSSHQSYCLLFTESVNEISRRRLNVFTKSNDGFALAQADLKMRGPGVVYGTAQKGFPIFKIATFGDLDLLRQTQAAANLILEDGIDKHALLNQRVDRNANWLAG